jgi:hypothetical protein
MFVIHFTKALFFLGREERFSFISFLNDILPYAYTHGKEFFEN